MVQGDIFQGIVQVLQDPDGNGTGSLSYSWWSSSDGSTGWANISGATTENYTITSSEEGKYIKAVVDYTDAEGHSESVFTFCIFQLLYFSLCPIDQTKPNLRYKVLFYIYGSWVE